MKGWLYGLALVGLLALAACAAQEKETSVPAAAPAAPAAKPAWEEEWERVLAAAKREGKVVIWGPPGADVRRALIEGFERRYGITVEYQGMRGEAVPRIKAEREAGQFLWDIFVGATSYPFLDLIPLGMLEPLDPALILPEVKEPKSWRGGELPFVDREHRHLAMLRYVTEALYYNPKLVPAREIKSYKDLLDPKWKGKIMVHDPSIPGSGDAKFGFLYSHRDLGPDYIRALARQEPFVTRDYNQLAEWVAVGRYALSLGGDKDVALPMKRAGASIEILPAGQMKEGGSIHVGMGGLSWFNRAPHPNAAKLYVNWLLSKEAQTAHSRLSGLPSTRADIPTDHIEPWQFPTEGYLFLDSEEGVKARVRIREFSKEVLGLR